jgi:hypothetical protein
VIPRARLEARERAIDLCDGDDRRDPRQSAIEVISLRPETERAPRIELHTHSGPSQGAIEALDRLPIGSRSVVREHHRAQPFAYRQGTLEMTFAEEHVLLDQSPLGEPFSKGGRCLELLLMSMVQVPPGVDESLHELQLTGGRSSISGLALGRALGTWILRHQ